MSKSIFEILDDLQTETSVPGQSPKDQQHTISRDQMPTSKEYEDEAKLLEWFRNHGCLHAGLQKGVRAHLIDLRAEYKKCKKGDTWSREYGQANLLAYQWDVQERPNQTGGKAVNTARFKDCLKAIAGSMAANMTEELIKTILTPVYGQDTVEACFLAIQKALDAPASIE